MKAPLLAFALLIFCVDLGAQSYLESYQHATFILNDSSQRSSRVNAKALLTKNTLQFEQTSSATWALRDVHRIIIDSTIYFVRSIKNVPDTLKLMEQMIDGKISLYRSPRISPNEELFAGKGNILYELRLIKKDIDGKTFEVREYASYLKLFTMDCEQINQRKLEDDLPFTFSAISSLITRYNGNCGWQKTKPASRAIKPRLTLGLLTGVLTVNHKLKYQVGGNIFEGNSSLFGIFAGPSLSVEFRKFYDTRVNYDLVFESTIGDGVAESHRHNFKFLHLKHILTFDVSLLRSKNVSLFAGPGLALQQLLNNNSTWSGGGGSASQNPEFFHSSKDKLNFSPLAQIHLGYRRFGVRYQAVGMSITMKSIELFSFEHRLALHMDLTTAK